VAVADPVYNELVKDDIKLMAELLKKLPDLKRDAALKYAGSAGEHLEAERIGGAVQFSVQSRCNALSHRLTRQN